MGKRNIVIGGAWPYANSSLHLGHLAALIGGDVLARYFRLNGDNVVYVSGTDCHGTPITQRARKENKTAKEIAENYHLEFTNTFKNMGFSYDLYGKTEDEFHKNTVQKMLEKMYENKYIYEKIDLQPYCSKCNRFLADRELKLICPSCGQESKGDQCDCGYIPKEKDLDGAICVECGEKVSLKENKNLYLSLKDLQSQIEKFFDDKSGNWRLNSKKETEKYLKENLPKINYKKPEGTYLAWVNFGAYVDYKELLDILITKYDLLIESGHVFGKPGEGYFRISVACPRVYLEEGLKRIVVAIKELTKLK